MRIVYAYFANQTIRQRFRFWIGVIVITLAFSMFVPFYMVERTDRLNEAANQLKQIVTLQSLYIERWNQEKLDTIRRFAISDNARQHRIGDLNRQISDYLRVQSEFSTVMYVEKDGYIRSEMNPNYQVFVGDRMYFRQAENKQTYISGMLRSKENGKPMITFSTPVLGDRNEFNGAMVGYVSIEKLGKMMERLSFGKTGEVFILDPQGMIVTASRSTSHQHDYAAMTSGIVHRAMNDIASDEAYIGFRGEKVFGHYEWSSDKSWIIVGEIAESEVFRTLNQLSMTFIFIALAALVISLAAAVTITSRIERPVRYLIRATKIIQNGNYNYQIDPEGIKTAPVELRQLCCTFNLMSDKLRSNIPLLEHSALMDPLTQIPNRRYMMAEGNNRLQNCIAEDQACSVMMLDIDHFKKINDAYGHLVGDRVLHHFAALLKQHAVGEAIAARYGGEEFILLTPGRSAEETLSIAEALRVQVMSQPFVDEQLSVPITVSIGIADYTDRQEYGTTVLEDMIARADHALYRAKSGGRNKVELDR